MKRFLILLSLIASLALAGCVSAPSKPVDIVAFPDNGPIGAADAYAVHLINDMAAKRGVK